MKSLADEATYLNSKTETEVFKNEGASATNDALK